MRFILSILILLFSFSFTFAQHRSDVEVNKSNMSSKPALVTFGFMGYGYIPMEVDKDLIGTGGGGGLKAIININRYFAIGFSTSLTGAKSNYANMNNLTLLSDSRILFILQRETGKYESGIVPWGGLGLGVMAGAGAYDVLTAEDMVGFNLSLMAGLRYNFKMAYIGFGAEYMFASLAGDLVYKNYMYPYREYRQPVTMNPSGFNIFGEIGFRF